MTSNLRWTYAAVALVTLANSSCGKPDAKPVAIRPVSAIKVGDVKAIRGRAFPGQAKAKGEVDLSFQVSGPLVSMMVDVGSKVKKGEVIAAIDPRDFQAALENAQGNLERTRSNLLAMERGARPEEVEQLRAALAEAEALYQQAKAEHERNAQLVESRTVTESDFDISLARAQQSAAQVKRATEELNIGLKGARKEDLDAKRSEIRALEAAVASAKNQLDYAVLTAPFDGEIAAKYVDNYQTVQSKQPILRVLDVSNIEVTVQIPESLIYLARQVKKVSCRFDALPGREFIGHVTKISSEASQVTRTYPVTVQLDQTEEGQILPGMAATISSIADQDGEASEGGLIVPVSAVFTDGEANQTYVWVVDETSKTVKSREIKTGELTPAGMTIAEGLQTGEWVVSVGVNSLVEGQAVRILQTGDR